MCVKRPLKKNIHSIFHSYMRVLAEVNVAAVVAGTADHLREDIRDAGVTPLCLRGELSNVKQLQQVSTQLTHLPDCSSSLTEG